MWGWVEGGGGRQGLGPLGATLLMFREAIGQKMENAYIVLYKLDPDIKYIGKQLGYTTSMT